MGFSVRTAETEMATTPYYSCTVESVEVEREVSYSCIVRRPAPLAHPARSRSLILTVPVRTSVMKAGAAPYADASCNETMHESKKHASTIYTTLVRPRDRQNKPLHRGTDRQSARDPSCPRVARHQHPCTSGMEYEARSAPHEPDHPTYWVLNSFVLLWPFKDALILSSIGILYRFSLQ